MGGKTELKGAPTERRSLRRHGRESQQLRDLGEWMSVVLTPPKCGLFGAILHSSAGLLQPLLNVCFHASLKSLFQSTHL